ncbi:chromosomal replication initiator protein DnaA [Candidatus Poribacteria bacterium]|nr:chromosomal replication initiator protein DnaA [Candidatus Poribacteria bacterium]
MNHSNGDSDDRSTQPLVSYPSELPTGISTSAQRLPASTGLNPTLTFDRFVVGQSNQEAFDAAKSMMNGAGEMEGVLVIHGGVGLGKTHLLHAIGNQFRQGHLNRTVYCSSAERFMSEWLRSIATPQKAAALRQQYKHVDLLLIDDIQFLSPEQKIQEEFFHLLNCLNERGQRLVCTCDHLPQFLKEFWDSPNSPRQGHTVEICVPEFDLRVSILKQKLKERESRPVPLKVLRYLAKHLTEHIRQLEGALNRLMAEVRLGSPLTLQAVHHVLESKTPDRPPPDTITLEHIQETVARYFHLTLSDLCSRKRGRRFVLPRQVGMYLTRQLTSLSLKEINQGFGQSRATVVRSCQRIETLLKEDLVLSQSIEALTAELTRPQHLRED